MAKLTKGEIAGVALVAELFVTNDLLTNVFAKDEKLKPHMDGLRQHTLKAAPKVALVEAELNQQIKQCRERWLNELSKTK